MNRLPHILLVAIVVVTGCSRLPKLETHHHDSEQAKTVRSHADGIGRAKTLKEIKASAPSGQDWTMHEIDGMKILIGLSELPTDSEPYIDINGYVYNRSFKEWRPFCLVKLRNVFQVKTQIDKDARVLRFFEDANSSLKGKCVFQINIAALSDDRAYAEKDTDKPRR